MLKYSDLKDGTINIFEMKELIDQYNIYMNGENFLQMKENEARNGR